MFFSQQDHKSVQSHIIPSTSLQPSSPFPFAVFLFNSCTLCQRILGILGVAMLLCGPAHWEPASHLGASAHYMIAYRSHIISSGAMIK